MTGGANLPETLADLDPLIESVDAAVSTDATLGGAVHYIVLDRMEKVGVRNIGPQQQLWRRRPPPQVHGGVSPLSKGRVPTKQSPSPLMGRRCALA